MDALMMIGLAAVTAVVGIAASHSLLRAEKARRASLVPVRVRAQRPQRRD